MVLADVQHPAPSSVLNVGWCRSRSSDAAARKNEITQSQRANEVSGVMSPIQYRCPDCDEQITFVAQQTAGDGDSYESALCPNCRELHSVNRATGHVLAEDGLGDPW